jgi:hypothetical protein
MPNVKQEWDAAGLVAGSLGGTRVIKTDDGTAGGIHDFEMTVPGGSLALEVTSTTVGEEHGMWSAIFAQNWETRKVRCGWSLSLRAAQRADTGPSVKTIRKCVEDHLLALEVAGISAFGSNHPQPETDHAADAVEKLKDLGVRAGSCNGPPPPGVRPILMIGTTGPAGMADGDDVTRAVEVAATENAAKLARAQVTERHLFVWIDKTDHECETAMLFGRLPKSIPAVPQGVDVVWAAHWAPGPTVPTTVIWQVRPPGAWTAPAVRYLSVQPSSQETR